MAQTKKENFMQVYQKEVKGINPIYSNAQNLEKTSNKYGFISSEKILQFFENKGFTLDEVSYAKTKDLSNAGYQKHIMIFSRPDLFIDNGNKLQLLVTNSHDAKSSLRLNIGVFRVVCANGLVSGEDFLERRVLHKGDFKKQLSESLDYIVANIGSVKDQVNTMKSHKVTFEQAQSYMKKVVDLRLENINGLKDINLATVDQVRRGHDAGDDIYTFFNRVQESIIRGGIRYTTETKKLDENKVELLDCFGNNILQIKNGTTRAIKDFTRKTELNKALWNEALKLAA